MNSELLETMMDWGYYLLPKAHPASPGYPAVYVSIRNKPTHQHFDPEEIETRVSNGHSFVEKRRLGLHVHGRLPDRICPGRLTLYDRFRKRTDFYTFGAQMRVEAMPDQAIYTFTSSAPILFLDEDDNDFPEQLEAEAEALVAEIHVAWRMNDTEFYQRLAQIEAFRFYTAALRSIHQRYTAHPSLHERSPHFYDRLQTEIQWQIHRTPDFSQGPLLPDLIGAPHR